MQLVLGTAQLGLDYGITNTNGKPKLTQSLEIIKQALDNDINIFDTARAYGDSEYILGLANEKYNNMNPVSPIRSDAQVTMIVLCKKCIDLRNLLDANPFKMSTCSQNRWTNEDKHK